MSYIGTKLCFADVSKKNILSADFWVKNFSSIVGPYLWNVSCPGSEGFSKYMGGMNSSPPCEMSPTKSPCEIGLSAMSVENRDCFMQIR